MSNFFIALRSYVSSARFVGIQILKGVTITLGAGVAIFFLTRGDIPHASELSFIEYSDMGDISGSVVPASCDSDPHSPYTCASPIVSNATISSGTVVPDGSTNYTISAYATSYSGSLSDQFVLINYQGTNAGTHRGYLGWHNASTGFYSWAESYKSGTPIACTGGGYGAIYGGGYGQEYIDLISCTKTTGGSAGNRTEQIDFVVHFNTNFVTPLTNNTLSTFVYEDGDGVPKSAGWTAYNTFTVAPSNCTTPWSATVTHTSATTSYQAASVNSPASCTSESRTCTNGTLSGSYQYPSCTVVTNGSCSATINTCTAGNFSDTADSGTQYLWNCAGINGGSTANCSVNKPTLVSANTAQSFTYGQAATAMSAMTITDATSPVITAANDIRIKIATSTLGMLWDTTDTTASISGTASGKVSTSVTYEGGGSVLVIPVNTNFGASEAITVSGLSFTSFTNVAVATTGLRLYLDGASDTGADDSGSGGTVGISGTLTLANHTAGQVMDGFNQSNETAEELFAFKLTPAGENVTVTSLAFSLQGIDGITGGNITNATLYRDTNSNGSYDGGDTAVGGSGAVSVSDQSGTITFSTQFSVTAATDYILVADIASLSGDDSLTVALQTSNIVTQGATSVISITGTGSSAMIQHIKAELGGGGSSASIGSAPPSGNGVTTGGEVGSGDGGGFIDSDSGDRLGNEPGFNPPSSTSGSWTSGSNAYASDGSYATAASSVTQTYGNFGFSVPTNNQITGIEVKLEASASTAAGTISVRLSWDNGTTDTSAVTTATLAATDGVYSLGGGSETWGRSWSASEFNNGNFVVEVVSNPSSNTVRIDAIQARVYHQSTGGGGGGGGAVFKDPERFFANVYTAVQDMWAGVFHRFFEWLFW